MENNLENKAKFFTQYWGQQVWCWIGKNSSHKYMTVGASRMLDLLISQAEIYLELTPLSSITDEDAVCLEKIREGDINSKVSDRHINGLISRGKAISALILSGGTIDINFAYWAETIDYLRSKGYAIGWMGLSVEELVKRNWIKLK